MPRGCTMMIGTGSLTPKQGRLRRRRRAATKAAAAHCQDLGQPRSETDPGFDDVFFYILVFGERERVCGASGSVFSPEMDNTCSQLHVGSGFLKKY